MWAVVVEVGRVVSFGHAQLRFEVLQLRAC